MNRHEANSEAAVKSALHIVVQPKEESARRFEEFWLPISNARADIAVVNGSLAAYEIKTHQDTLRRLPGQVAAFGQVFDYCTAVVAERHLEKALRIIPAWWGVMSIGVGQPVRLDHVRTAQLNDSIDPTVLVRLLWRKEVDAALTHVLGREHQLRSRAAMWRELVDVVELDRLRAIVRNALLRRTGQASPLSSKRR